jgi:sulfoxide reductase heme-binding subunit YedZ
VSDELLWYTGRGTGVVALVMLTLVVVLGILSRSGRPAAGLTRFALADVHRNASLIATGLVLVHVIVLWMDPYAKLRIFDLIVPFDAVYRPFWVGLGTIASEIMALLVVTSLLRRHIGVRAWKVIHWLSYAMWPIAWMHGWFTGTDAGRFWFRLIAILCLGAAIAAVAWRLSPNFLEIPRPRPTTAEPTASQAIAPGPGLGVGPRHAADWHREPSGQYPTWHREPSGQYPTWRREPTGPQPTWPHREDGW